MKLLLDSFWRACLYCLSPRVIGLSLLPFGMVVALSWLLGYLYWDDVVQSVRNGLEATVWLSQIWLWLDGVGLPNLKTVVAPLVVIFSVTPLVVVASLLAVSFFMTTALTRMVAERRFATLQRKEGASFLQSVLWTLLSVVLALGAFLVTLPWWLVPPLALVLPALIWGWLTYRVLVFDVLADFASTPERRTLMARHRMAWLGMGVATGLMGAAPSVVWASGALFAAAFVILVPLAIWIYMLVFAFSSLWFAHFALAALQALRDESSSADARVDGGPTGPTLAPSPQHLAKLGGAAQGPREGVTDVDPRPLS